MDTLTKMSCRVCGEIIQGFCPQGWNPKYTWAVCNNCKGTPQEKEKKEKWIKELRIDQNEKKD